jgi:hypothetical protein
MCRRIHLSRPGPCANSLPAGRILSYQFSCCSVLRWRLLLYHTIQLDGVRSRLLVPNLFNVAAGLPSRLRLPQSSLSFGRCAHKDHFVRRAALKRYPVPQVHSFSSPASIQSLQSQRLALTARQDCPLAAFCPGPAIRHSCVCVLGDSCPARSLANVTCSIGCWCPFPAEAQQRCAPGHIGISHACWQSVEEWCLACEAGT